MDSGLYIALHGAERAMQQQRINANNIANVNTTGFQADMYQAQSVYLNGEGVNLNVFAQNLETLPNLTPGPVQTTGRDLDVAIDDQGFFAVQLPNGTEAYTRAGEFKLDENGQLLSRSNLPVMGEGGPIAIPPASEISIAADGTISIRPVGADANSLALIDRLKLVNPDIKNLKKNEQGLFVTKSGSQAPVDSNIKVLSGALNGSNVNAAGAMVDMITAAREFEQSMLMVKEYSKMTDNTAQLLQLS